MLRKPRGQGHPTVGMRGPDLLRALAMGRMFADHDGIFVSDPPGLGALGPIGRVGVDLFFVLSGTLIGHQILAGTARGQELAVPRLRARPG